MAKRKEDLKKIVSISISSKQHLDLKDLAEYAGKSVSETICALIPSTEEIEAWQAYQDFCDLGEPQREKVLNKITKTRRLFIEVVMSNHVQCTIGLQVAAVSYFDRDKNGVAIFKLFKNWINALRSKRGYRFETDRYKFPDKQERIYYICLAPGESREDVDEIIGKYCTLAPNAEVLNAIKRSARVLVRKKKKAKRVKQKKVKKQ